MATQREQVKEIMLNLFGPATAKLVDQMDDADVVPKCRAKVVGFFGEEKGKLFDAIK